MRSLLLIFLTACIAAPATAQVIDSRALQRIGAADTNNDGVVTRAELTAHRNAQFRALDRNRDGYLSAADRPRLLVSRQGFDPASLIVQFDANNDGKVSRVELASGPTPAFDAADTNHDDQVTQAELEAAIARARA